MKNLFYYLKIAIRNLRSNKLYSIINILGLSVSLAAVILIVLWVQDELGYDKYHKRHQDMYVVVGHGMNNSAESFGEGEPHLPAPLPNGERGSTQR